MIRKAITFFDERLGASRFVRSSFDKVFPDHYAFLLGEIALYCFVVLIGTGVFLTFFFNASSTEVVYQASVEPGIPMIGFMKRKIQGQVIDIALKGLKKRVESQP